MRSLAVASLLVFAPSVASAHSALTYPTPRTSSQKERHCGAANSVRGTNVTVLPRFDSVTRDVEVKLDADVADLTPPASGTIPGRNTTQLQTLVTLKLGQALVLSGLKTDTKRNDIQGLPLLSQIPVLGVLFGSHAKNSQEVEAAIFIVPSVVDSVPKSSLDVIRNAMSTYDEFSGGMKGLDTFPSTPPAAK